MGAVWSSREVGEETAASETQSQSQQYPYPPKSGSYFGSHFLMGGERFESGPGEGHFLFGENADLNFLPARPTSYPYPWGGQSAEPTRTLQCLLNLRRDSLKLVRVGDSSPPAYRIVFTFDCDCPIQIQILYFVTETADPVHGVLYTPRDPSQSSPVYRYEMGAAQTFDQAEARIIPGLHKASELAFQANSAHIPLVIKCVAEEGSPPSQVQATLAEISESAEGSGGWIVKPLKQKLCVQGVAYLLQEIFGIENKNPLGGLESDGEPKGDETLGDLEENGADCVVCMSELRDTLILPCRHLCLCNACAETLRYKASACPICRSPFKALLQIKTLRRLGDSQTPAHPVHSEDGRVGDGSGSGSSSAPARYEAVSLVEALNGPMDHTQTVPPHPPSTAGTLLSTAVTVPSAPPRGHRPQKKKKCPASAPRIQEVLTPATAETAPSPSPSRPPEELEMVVRVREGEEQGIINILPSSSPESRSQSQRQDVSPPLNIQAEEEEKSAASSFGSNKPLLNVSTALEMEADEERADA